MAPEDVVACEQAIVEMEKVTSAFYGEAVRVGNHAFIEFTGIMNEYIKTCRWNLERGLDFRQINIHTGIGLDIPEHQLAYLNEKLECIYGRTFTLVPLASVTGSSDDEHGGLLCEMCDGPGGELQLTEDEDGSDDCVSLCPGCVAKLMEANS